MRILFTAPEIIPPIFYGGTERIVASLITELRCRGHIVGLMADVKSTQHVDAFFPWAKPSVYLALDTFRNVLALRKMVRSFCPEVIHSYYSLSYLLLLCNSVPKIAAYQGAPNLYKIVCGRHMVRGNLVFNGCSKHIAKLGRRGGGMWHAIPNHVDPKSWTFVPEVAQDAPLVFLSRIERIKGCHTAIVIAKASNRRLLIAGNRGPTRRSVDYWDREIAPHLGRDGIEYVGPVNDEQKNELLGLAAALLVPIEWEEPFGIVFIEALACGTPVVSFPRGAIPEIVEDGIHGFHIRSIQEGIKAVAKLPVISREACRKQVEQQFSVNLIADQYLALYRSILSC